MRIRRNKYFVYYFAEGKLSGGREIDKEEFEFATKNPEFLCELKDSDKECEVIKHPAHTETRHHFRHKIFDICYVHLQTKKGYSW
jgi:hypothetical protein